MAGPCRTVAPFRSSSSICSSARRQAVTPIVKPVRGPAVAGGVLTGPTMAPACCRGVSASRRGGEADLDHTVADLHPVDGQRQRRIRSEEHTSELQSLMRTSYAVFCLKTKQPINHIN